MMRLANLFRPKPMMVFISDSDSCPCLYLYDLARSIPGLKCIHISELNSDETRKKTRRVRMARKLLIFVHGSLFPLSCFFYRKTGNRDQKIYITNQWWDETIGQKQIVYLRACHGADIVRNSDTIQLTFQAWVSYSGLVDNVQTSYNRIRQIQQSFLRNISDATQRRSNPVSLKASVEAAYKQAESDLHEEDHFIPGYTAMIQMIGKNILLLDQSKRL